MSPIVLLESKLELFHMLRILLILFDSSSRASKQVNKFEDDEFKVCFRKISNIISNTRQTWQAWRSLFSKSFVFRNARFIWSYDEAHMMSSKYVHNKTLNRTRVRVTHSLMSWSVGLLKRFQHSRPKHCFNSTVSHPKSFADVWIAAIDTNAKS